MKVLFFLRRIGPYHHARFRSAMEKFELVVAETRPTSEEYAWKFRPGGEYLVEQFPASEEKEKGIRGPALEQTIKVLLKKHKPDVIVNTGWADPEYNEVVIHASREKIPLVVISDSKKDVVPRKFYLEWIKRLIVKAYSSALVAGTESADYIIGLGFRNDAIFKPWDVVDNEYFHNASVNGSIPFSDRKFVCIARFIEAKNLHRLLEAYSGYVKEGGKRRLVVIGGGPLERSLRGQLSPLGIGHMAELHGFVQQDEIIRHFSEALALILPSTSEQWGLAINEAMAFGLPVVVSAKCGCAIDLVDENRNGIIFDPLNVEAIKLSMQRMDSFSETRWREMGLESYTIIRMWGLREFAEGLEWACLHALRSPLRKPFVSLHKLLAR
jgi:glycosyltransferase involved in cell wall biosynthesis